MIWTLLLDGMSNNKQPTLNDSEREAIIAKIAETWNLLRKIDKAAGKLPARLRNQHQIWVRQTRARLRELEKELG
jgi:hypothetical protein